jgi:N,N'-diacetyllegionaminate synthase
MDVYEPSATMQIAGSHIGADAPTYVIAEIGSNHNRDLGLARELIDSAAEASVDAVKFQVFSGSGLYSTKTPSFRYLSDVSAKPTAELLEDLALPRDWLGELAEHAHERGLHFLASPFDAQAVSQLRDAGADALKIASFEIVDLELIAATASSGLPLILSCGMASYGEIEDALAAARKAGCMQMALLRCASLYPAPAQTMNLHAMATMRRAFGVPVGLSDHTTGIAVALGACGVGMDLLEKHFTLDRSLPGPDHSFAIEPAELRELVAGIRAIESALGNGRVEGPSDAEAQEMYRLARRSVIAARAIPAGSAIAREQLTVKRPGWGIAPKDIDRLVGRVARVDIEADEVITWEKV